MNLLSCPRCGEGKLFRSLLDMNDQCSACGLAFTQEEQGDGPAFFAILIIGAVVAIGASVVEIKYEPPFWVHAAIWIPFITIGTVVSLRFLKAALVQMQYRVREDDSK